MGWKTILSFGDFNDEFKEILNHQAPIKQSKLRAHTKPDIKNKADKSGKDKRLYNTQRHKLNNNFKKLKLIVTKVQVEIYQQKLLRFQKTKL